MYKFEKLKVWELSLDYLDKMYELADQLPDKEKYNLTSQLRRAATSICLNIAEGSTGQTDKEQSRFLGMAIRSLIETVAVQKVVKRRQYVADNNLLAAYYNESQVLSRKLQAFRNSLYGGRNWAREDEEEYE